MTWTTLLGNSMIGNNKSAERRIWDNNPEIYRRLQKFKPYTDICYCFNCSSYKKGKCVDTDKERKALSGQGCPSFSPRTQYEKEEIKQLVKDD